MREATPKTSEADLNAKAAGGVFVEQAGAICYRKISREVLLITSRRSGRWGIPKGNIEVGETSLQAAEREAFEEAGIRGACAVDRLGTFRYRKDGASAVYRVSVHVLDVQLALTEFPETDQRLSKWVGIGDAADAVYQPELKELLQILATLEATADTF
ncbi:NUDIX hydrolase [Rhizobium sp. HT1-10]|uniref:NUDIX hydrolase n=1 Tax=Rhizobium sp. HT1-10 TaxID=3111638 RepID=UPI003C1A1B3A